MKKLLLKLDERTEEPRMSCLSHYPRLINRYSHPINFKSKEIQLVTLLRNIIALFIEFERKLNAKIGEEMKENMRERQRNNLKQFKQKQHVFSLFLKLAKRLLGYLIENYVIEIELIGPHTDDRLSIHQLYDEQNHRFNDLIKFLKNLLKLSQNLVCKFGENKWSECLDLILKNEKIKFNIEFFKFL